jgi:hypothetical protein
MNSLLKGVCLVVYLLAFAGLFFELPGGMTKPVQVLALILLAAHALEVVVAFGKVKLYRGPLAVSVALTVLFGFLHWMPLARANARTLK